MPVSPSDAEASAWVQVCSTPTMGNGLFAARDIPPGTRMIAEKPILTITATAEDDIERAFCHAWYNLPEEKQKKLDELFYIPSLITQTTRDTIREWYKENGITASNGVVFKGKRLQDASKAMTKRFAIFLTNRVQMGHTGAYGSGLFSFYSRINHSCIPNSHNAYNPTLGCLTIHSTHRIRAGEQLFISYIDGACRTHSQRQNELDKWGFSCGCQACTTRSDDEVRSRMLDIDQGLAAYESPLVQLASRMTSPLAPMIARRMPTNKREALSDAKELAGLLRQQRLEGMDLCKTYRECSKYCLELGDRPLSVWYATRELEIERRLIGTETAHLESDMSGAVYWLKHLQEA